MFADRLSSCMALRGLSPHQLSERSGISAAAISRYLNGLRMPSADSLVCFSKALSVSSDYLLGLSDDPASAEISFAYERASAEDRRVVCTLLERYGGPAWSP